MRIYLILFLLIFTFGCATRHIKYDRNKISKKYSKNYTTFVDNKKMALETVYLDKNNIKDVIINRKLKELKITQFKRTKLFEIKNLNLDSLSAGRRGWKKNKIALIVIDGIPIIDSLKEKTKIDINTIEHLEIIPQDKMNKGTTWCRGFNGDVLIIKTK